MAKGPLGAPRPLGIGPLTEGGLLFNQPDSAQEMNDLVVEVAEDMGVGISTADEDEVDEVMQELATEVYPDSELKQNRLINCIESNWAEAWTEESLESVGQEDMRPLEELAKAANGCVGMVDANTLG